MIEEPLVLALPKNSPVKVSPARETLSARLSTPYFLFPLLSLALLETLAQKTIRNSPNFGTH